jgi:hypothetical protein
VNLPGRLRASTLGDLLGKLHRARLSGVLELTEVGGPSAGKRHRIHLRAGLVDVVEEVVVEEDGGEQPPTVREIPTSPMPRAVVQRKMESLFALADAELTFHVVTRRPISTLPPEPLTPPEFLHGRPRARDRMTTSERVEPTVSTLRRRALATLGLPAEATADDVHRAFKMLALRVHPDRHPGADDHEREVLSTHFARLTAAYHALIA